MVLDTEPEDGDDHTEWAVIAPTFADGRDKCMEGPSGLLKALGGLSGDLVATWNRSLGHLTLSTGAVIYVDSAHDGGQRIQGRNLYGSWCDEIGLWRSWPRTWDESLLFALRKGPHRVIATGTPKHSSLAKHLLDDPRVGRRRLRMADNQDNLAPEVVEELTERFAGTSLGDQELNGLLIGDIEGALWRRDVIDRYRVHEHLVLEGPEAGSVYWQRADGSRFPPPRAYERVVVALDPADGTERGDEQGLAVLAQSMDDHELYLLRSEGHKRQPLDFLNHAVSTALDFKEQGPASITVEKNHGAGYLVDGLYQVMRQRAVSVPVHVVDANVHTGGKRQRALGVVGLWERGKVHHVGTFAELEDQQCSWSGLGNERSPDRMDAVVWAAMEFETVSFGPIKPVVAIPWAGSPGLARSVSRPQPGREERVLEAVRW